MPKLLALTLALSISVLSTGVHAAEQPWIARSNDNAKLLLGVVAKYAPEFASQTGIEGYDEAITDFSHDTYQAQNDEINQAIAEYQRRATTEPDPRVRQDLEIMIGAGRDMLSANAVNRKYFFPFIDVTGLIYGTIGQTLDPRIPPARQQALLARLQKYAGLAQGYRPATDLARERTLERRHAEPGLIGPYRDAVQQAISDTPTLLAGGRALLAKSKLRGWQKTYALLEHQCTEYASWLKSQLLPLARSDHRLPPEVYADNLHQYGVDVPPEELISKALTSFAEIRNQMNITAGLIAGERGYPDGDYHAVIRKLKEQQLAADQVLPTYQQRLGQIEAAIRTHAIVTLPQRAAVIRLATAAENAQQPAPHMNPPRLVGNTGEYGEFILTTGVPAGDAGKQMAFDDFSHQAATWTLTAHEARPGHELQFAKMIETGVSTARAVFAFNSVNVEGWALYAEAELQPYEPLDGQLFALQARAERAARAFLDPMVNLGQITPDEVKSFMMDEVMLSEGMATQEMQRYVFRAPGQATAYFYGYQRLMETRQAAQLALRQQFDRLAFNDFVLAQGLVPPRLLRQAVMEEFVPARMAASSPDAAQLPQIAPP